VLTAAGRIARKGGEDVSFLGLAGGGSAGPCRNPADSGADFPRLRLAGPKSPVYLRYVFFFQKIYPKPAPKAVRAKKSLKRKRPKRQKPKNPCPNALRTAAVFFAR
jgi:hypothetical protein